jgi:hypothetical protein
LSPSAPRYSFREERSFQIARSQLRLDDRTIDEHLLAIQDQIAHDPYATTTPVPERPGYFVAVSNPTTHSPVALRVAFTIEGDTIVIITVGRRE